MDAPATPTAPDSRPRVLLVESDTAARTTLAGLLRTTGLAVTEADSREAALARYRETDPAVVFLCAELNELAHDELLAAIRNEHPAQAVVIAAPPADHRITDLLDNGVYAYLPKPLNPGLLVAVLWTAVRQATRDEPATDRAWLATGVPDARREINLVIGILMERYRFTQRVAYRRLRHYARCHRRPLRDLARELLIHQEHVNQALGDIAGGHAEARRPKPAPDTSPASLPPLSLATPSTL